MHTDQGSVYSSQAFLQGHEHYNIKRSMSRVGTPTDNAIIEAINGWIKEELFLDFGLATAKEVGVNLTNGYNGHLTSREAGSVGGQMVKNRTPERSKIFARECRIAADYCCSVRYIFRLAP